ncbi:hypothetical protein TNCT_431361 [Trichonephila clavata]|uniref:Uncharacterized protein n=1 Tax=Trichonephila clavata TaxID=2740835 RepID=A0A8X6GBU1_TRICU|nr:hypothetical protein TNCT_431361 [Trichonephila clavata]
MFHPCLVISVQMFQKIGEAIELFNSLDSDESDVEIAMLSLDTSDDEDEGNENKVSSGEIIVNDIPGYLEVRTGDSFYPEPSTKSI